MCLTMFAILSVCWAINLLSLAREMKSPPSGVEAEETRVAKKGCDVWAPFLK